MEHDTITISRHATAVATAVATAERKPPDAVAARPGPAEPPELELLGNQIAELSARIDAATYELLCHLHEFDRRHGWEGWRSCAHWLNWRTGLDLGAAREKLRVAAALADLNHVAAAMARGQLSYSKVRALTRVASPATEARLLAVALSGAHRRAGGADGAGLASGGPRRAAGCRAGAPGQPGAEHAGGRGRHGGAARAAAAGGGRRAAARRGGSNGAGAGDRGRRRAHDRATALPTRWGWWPRVRWPAGSIPATPPTASR